MKLTLSDIKDSIPSLSDDQASAALELVQKQVGETTKTIYNNLEKDILDVTGKTKPDGEKSYTFLRSVLGEGVTSSKELEASKAKIEKLNDQYEDLKGKVEAGDKTGATAAKVEQLEKDLEAARTLATDLEGQLTTKSQEWQSKFDEQNAATELARVDAAIDRSFGAISFKEGLSPKVRELVEQDARNALRSMDREWIDGKLVFKSETGQILRHQDTAIPYTATDILTSHLTEAEAIAVNRTQAGAGSKKAGITATSTEGGFQLSGERDQVTATKNLTAHLTETGLKPGTIEFQTALDETYAEVIIPANLPTQVSD